MNNILKKTMGPWINAYYCSECEEELLTVVIGCCPKCGQNNHSMIGYLYHRSGQKRFIRTVPWWKFWGDIGYWEYK